MGRASIEPRRWRPPTASARARQSRSAEPVELTVFDVPGRGPEDVAVDAGGTVYAGVADGRILRMSADGRRVDTLADTGGRPLGVEIDPDGDLLVCDARAGLLHVAAATGQVRVVADKVAGERMVFCNNGAVARDGTRRVVRPSR